MLQFDAPTPLIGGAHLPMRVRGPQWIRFCNIVTLGESQRLLCMHQCCFANPSHIDCLLQMFLLCLLLSHRATCAIILTHKIG
jgi:hypothetical protein